MRQRQTDAMRRDVDRLRAQLAPLNSDQSIAAQCHVDILHVKKERINSTRDTTGVM
jgi:hypothetical protein